MEKKKKKKEVAKPLLVALDDFKNDLINLINKAHLSAYLLEPTFKEMYEQCKSQARQELADAKKEYREAQKELYTQELQPTIDNKQE